VRIACVSEQAGRYQRSFSGMAGAMLVTLLVITAFVVFRALNRNEVDERPKAVDYLGTVDVLQEEGLSVVYPPDLPDGWRATSVDFQPGEQPAWGVGFLTDDGRFVGIRQEDAALDDLLASYVDEATSELGETEVSGSVARRWQVFRDDGGDTAYAAELGDDWVIVYGSAPRADVETMVQALTTERR
jgi:Protein of unknown function (DUF4245)